MLKKTIVLALVVVLMVSCLVLPASAARVYFDFTDYIVSSETVGDTDRVYVTVPKQNLYVKVRDQYGQIVSAEGDENGVTLTLDVVAGKVYKINYGAHYLWMGNIPNNQKFEFRPTFSYSGVGHSTVDMVWYSTYLDAEAATVYDDNYVMINNVDFVVGSSMTAAEFSHSGDKDIYSCSFGYSLQNFVPSWSGKITLTLSNIDLNFAFPAGYMEKLENDNNAIIAEKNQMLLLNQQALLEELESQQAVTNDKLDYTNEQLDQMPGEIGDEIEGIIDKENQNASNAGDNAANELLDIIPNESDGFIDAIGSLVNSMSYNGTDAVLPVPAITLPEIPGVMSAVKLTDKQEVDFGFWIEKLPSNILQLVRILCTIALIVYCFKELYSTISYALTLKGGKSDE